MYKYAEIQNLALDLLNLAEEEYNYLLKLENEEEYEDNFLHKKQELRNIIENLLIVKDLNEKDKKNLKEIFIKCHNLEEKIGLLYEEKLQLIRENMANINKEKKLKEAYAKSGMDFNLDNSLK